METLKQILAGMSPAARRAFIIHFSEGVIVGLFSLALLVVASIRYHTSYRAYKSAVTQKKDAEVKLARLEEDRKTGMMAVSVLSELEGWGKFEPHAEMLLKSFCLLPEGVRLSQFMFEQPICTYGLPAELQAHSLYYSLGMPRQVKAVFNDIGDGFSTVERQVFVEDINRNVGGSYRITSSVGHAEKWSMLSEEQVMPLWSDHVLDMWLVRAGLRGVQTERMSDDS